MGLREIRRKDADWI